MSLDFEYIEYVKQEYIKRNGNLNGLDETDDVSYYNNEALMYGFKTFDEFKTEKSNP